MNELKFTGNIRRLRLRPGDFLVIELPEHVSREMAATFREQISAKFPDNEIMVVGGGARVASVLRKDAA